jgi:DNA-binding MarR family transcriptional regulator
MRAERVAQGLQPELSDSQLAALAALEKRTMTPGELAEHEKVQPPSITRVIASLEERGLIQRMPHPSDRRQVVLTVTDQGRDVVRRVRQLRTAWLAQRLRDLTPAERAVLREALPILEKLSQSLPAEHQPPPKISASAPSARSASGTSGSSPPAR